MERAATGTVRWWRRVGQVRKRDLGGPWSEAGSTGTRRRPSVGQREAQVDTVAASLSSARQRSATRTSARVASSVIDMSRARRHDSMHEPMYS